MKPLEPDMLHLYALSGAMVYPTAAAMLRDHGGSVLFPDTAAQILCDALIYGHSIGPDDLRHHAAAIDRWLFLCDCHKPDSEAWALYLVTRLACEHVATVLPSTLRHSADQLEDGTASIFDIRSQLIQSLAMAVGELPKAVAA